MHIALFGGLTHKTSENIEVFVYRVTKCEKSLRGQNTLARQCKDDHSSPIWH